MQKRKAKTVVCENDEGSRRVLFPSTEKRSGFLAPRNLVWELEMLMDHVVFVHCWGFDVDDGEDDENLRRLNLEEDVSKETPKQGGSKKKKGKKSGSKKGKESVSKETGVVKGEEEKRTDSDFVGGGDGKTPEAPLKELSASLDQVEIDVVKKVSKTMKRKMRRQRRKESKEAQGTEHGVESIAVDLVAENGKEQNQGEAKLEALKTDEAATTPTIEQREQTKDNRSTEKQSNNTAENIRHKKDNSPQRQFIPHGTVANVLKRAR